MAICATVWKSLSIYEKANLWCLLKMLVLGSSTFGLNNLLIQVVNIASETVRGSAHVITRLHKHERGGEHENAGRGRAGDACLSATFLGGTKAKVRIWKAGFHRLPG